MKFMYSRALVDWRVPDEPPVYAGEASVCCNGGYGGDGQWWNKDELSWRVSVVRCGVDRALPW